MNSKIIDPCRRRGGQRNVTVGRVPAADVDAVKTVGLPLTRITGGGAGGLVKLVYHKNAEG
jgi:hypothetical protein